MNIIPSNENYGQLTMLLQGCLILRSQRNDGGANNVRSPDESRHARGEDLLEGRGVGVVQEAPATKARATQTDRTAKLLLVLGDRVVIKRQLLPVSYLTERVDADCVASFACNDDGRTVRITAVRQARGKVAARDGIHELNVEPWWFLFCCCCWVKEEEEEEEEEEEDEEEEEIKRTRNNSQ